MARLSIAPAAKDRRSIYNAGAFGRRDRMASWQNYFSQLWGPSRVSAVSKVTFDASVDSIRFGRLQLNQFHVRGQKITRRSGDSAVLESAFHALNTVHRGQGVLTSKGEDLVVQAGEVLLSSSPVGNVFTVPEDFVATQLMIPSALLADYIPGAPEVLLFRDDASSLRISLLRGMLAQLVDGNRAHLADTATTQLVEKHVLELLALSVEMKECAPVSDETSVCFAHRLRLQRLIRENLSRPELSPPVIAALGGISESYLHRIFSASGMSAMQVLRNLRMEKAKSLLTADVKPRLSMGQIAYECGFSSHSSFTRSFHKHFGIAPKDMRRSLQ